MDEKSTEELIQLAHAEEDDDSYNEIVTEIRRRDALSVLPLATELCQSDDPINRELGADILGQLGFFAAKNLGDRPFQEEIVPILIELLNDKEATVIATAAYALGFRNAMEAVPALIKHKTHPNDYVRGGVVSGLSGLEDDAAINALIDLSEDEVVSVRDWATFGLGSQIIRDTPEIRAALHKRLDDEDEETRGEAFVGLAERGDTSIKERLIKELEMIKASNSDTGGLAQEAADLLGIPY